MGLDRSHNFGLSCEVSVIPSLISQIMGPKVFEPGPIIQQLVEELYAKDFNLLQRFELRDIHVRSFGDIEENSVDKVQKHFEFQVLAP